MPEFLMICGLPRSGTRELADILNAIDSICLQGEITGGSFKHACKFVNDIVSDSHGLNKERLLKKGAALLSDALGVAGKGPLLKKMGKLELVGFKCPNAQNWHQDILQLANTLNFKVHIVLCVRDANEVYRSLTQMDWYDGEIERFENMCLKLIKTHKVLSAGGNPALSSLKFFNLNEYIESVDRAKYIFNLVNGYGVSCNLGDVESAVSKATNRNATSNKSKSKTVDSSDLELNKKRLSGINKKLRKIQEI